MPTTVWRTPTHDWLGAADDGWCRYEIVRDELRVREAAVVWCRSTIVAMAARLARHGIERRTLRVAPAGTAFVLARDPHTVRVPDIALVTRSRARALDDGARVLDGAPDLSVDVRSPHDRGPDVEERAAAYVAAGGRLAWLADPGRERVTVYRRGMAPRLVSGRSTIDGGEVLRGFACPVRRLLRVP